MGEPWEEISGLRKVIRGQGGAMTEIESSASSLPSTRLGATAWVFDDPAVEASFHRSDDPSEAANRAIDAAYKKARDGK